jgi:hypothetical protein
MVWVELLRLRKRIANNFTYWKTMTVGSTVEEATADTISDVPNRRWRCRSGRQGRKANWFTLRKRSALYGRRFIWRPSVPSESSLRQQIHYLLAFWITANISIETILSLLCRWWLFTSDRNSQQMVGWRTSYGWLKVGGSGQPQWLVDWLVERLIKRGSQSVFVNNRWYSYYKGVARAP